MTVRDTLKAGSRLVFPGMDIEITSVLGCGSNAVVYKGSYEDGLSEGMKHTVLVKELFPYHPNGLIFRNESGAIEVRPEAADDFALHRQSFERGNEAHLKLLALHPDKVGGNVNTYKANGTLYTVLSESGGHDISASAAPVSIKQLMRRMLSILDALEAFHATGLLHLDISPDNILLIGSGENERAMLIDYNSVFSPGELTAGENAYLSVKYGYTAPEVINRSLSMVSWSTDLYSVAAVFFFMLTGRALTLAETLQKNPPDVQNENLIKDAPETVKGQVKTILKKGLCSIPSRRYKTISEMREAFLELLNRIDMVGVTHSALWEAGKKSALKLVRDNAFYGYIEKEADQFPVRLNMENGESMNMDAFIAGLISETGANCFLVSAGGMGKTTALLKTALSISKSYSPVKPAQLYLSLAGRKDTKKDFLLDSILQSLRFTGETVTYDSARHALKALLSSPLKSKSGDVPVLVLLLDGLNEATGDTALLYQEINELSKLPGLRILLSSRAENELISFIKAEIAPLTDEDVQNALKKRGLLLPQSQEICSALKTPLMLSIFIQASGDESQLAIETEAELMDAYLQTLLTKEMDAVGDDENEKYRISYAVKVVLPAIAAAMEKGGGTLSEKALFEKAEKARKTLLSPNLSRAFDEYLGHRKETALESPDEFYGRLVHGVLWRRMGLVVFMGENARISHAIIAENLAGKYAENARKIRKRKTLLASALALAVLLFLSGAYLSFRKWGKDYVITVEKPKPAYEDALAEKCLSYAVNGYTEYGMLYDRTKAYLSGAQAASLPDNSSANNLYVRMIDRMMASEGEVISWSKKPFDAENARNLIYFSSECRLLYDEAIACHQVWNESAALKQRYPEYPELFRALLDADAKVAVNLYQVVCAPHQVNSKNDDIWQTERMKNIALSSGLQESFEHARSAETGENALQDLANAQARRTEAVTNLKKLLYQLSLYTKTGGTAHD